MSKNLLLSSIIQDWPEEIWLDTGILYPFFQKDVTTDPHCWLNELIALSRKNKVFTTQSVVNELKKVWKYWRPKDRGPMSKRYHQLFDLIDIKHHNGQPKYPLSATDVSLTMRNGGTLFTSDRALYEMDSGPTVLIKVEFSNQAPHQSLSILSKT